jgi:hypothetical protein
MQPVPKPAPRKAQHIRIPAFLPVPLRSRRDGWTVWRQGAFLVALARTRSVAAAAGEVGLSRVSAYRLRGRAGAEDFAAAWDAALGGAGRRIRKLTQEERLCAATGGLVKPLVWRGRCIAIARKFDTAALLGLLLRLDPKPVKAGTAARFPGVFR